MVRPLDLANHKVSTIFPRYFFVDVDVNEKTLIILIRYDITSIIDPNNFSGCTFFSMCTRKIGQTHGFS